MIQELKVIENFFQKNEIRFIKKYAEDIFESKEILRSSKKEWQKGLNDSSNEILIYSINQIIDSEIHNIISLKIEKEFGMNIGGMSFFFYTNQSNIDWHNDAGWAGAATIYLNEKWDKEDGGFFIYKKDEKFGIELPEFNKCIFQKNRVEHATTLTSKNAPVRKILQVFFKNE
jgi:hypothetical protein